MIHACSRDKTSVGELAIATEEPSTRNGARSAPATKPLRSVFIDAVTDPAPKGSCSALPPRRKETLPRRSHLSSLPPAARRAAEQYCLRLEDYAARMRHDPSSHEARLWEALRSRRLGVAFRRQVLLGDASKKLYIVDFCAPQPKLVVEVDDASHSGREARDARRDAALGRLGYRVVRIPVRLLECDFPGAVELVRRAIPRP
ncbi:MAG: hypothetical protein B6A08_06860 [Sorangiineae bacterium NIC37A_2]|nr:MAG: hypothetical protein B6A08_06860 [Sorangiineae bacterium NIC37A_2]